MDWNGDDRGQHGGPTPTGFGIRTRDPAQSGAGSGLRTRDSGLAGPVRSAGVGARGGNRGCPHWLDRSLGESCPGYHACWLLLPDFMSGSLSWQDGRFARFPSNGLSRVRAATTMAALELVCNVRNQLHSKGTQSHPPTRERSGLCQRHEETKQPGVHPMDNGKSVSS